MLLRCFLRKAVCSRRFPQSTGACTPYPSTLKIHQRGVQWKQGVVIYMLLYTSLLYNTTPIHCTPLRLHPPVMNTHALLLLVTERADAEVWGGLPRRFMPGKSVWHIIDILIQVIVIICSNSNISKSNNNVIWIQYRIVYDILIASSVWHIIQVISCCLQTDTTHYMQAVLHAGNIKHLLGYPKQTW